PVYIKNVRKYTDIRNEKESVEQSRKSFGFIMKKKVLTQKTFTRISTQWVPEEDEELEDLIDIYLEVLKISYHNGEKKLVEINVEKDEYNKFEYCCTFRDNRAFKWCAKQAVGGTTACFELAPARLNKQDKSKDSVDDVSNLIDSYVNEESLGEKDESMLYRMNLSGTQ
ncbi:23369_t:CDS:2, partial [Dentiscutata erythropus]